MTHARAGTPQRLGAELVFYGVPAAVGLGEPQYGASIGYSGGERRVTQAVVKYVHADRRLLISSLPCWSHPDAGTFRNWLLHFPPVLVGQKHEARLAALHEKRYRIRIEDIETTLECVHYRSSWVGVAEHSTAPCRVVIHSVNIPPAAVAVLVPLVPPTSSPRPNADV